MLNWCLVFVFKAFPIPIYLFLMIFRLENLFN